MSQTIKCSNPFCGQNIVVPDGVGNVICPSCSTLHYLEQSSANDQGIQNNDSGSPQYGYGNPYPSGSSTGYVPPQATNPEPYSNYSPGINQVPGGFNPNVHPQISLNNGPSSVPNYPDPSQSNPNLPNQFYQSTPPEIQKHQNNFENGDLYRPPVPASKDSMNFGVNPHYQTPTYVGEINSERKEEIQTLPQNKLGVLIANNGQRFILKPGVNTIGRKNTDIVLEHNSVSRKHCVIEVNAAVGGQWNYIIYDIGFVEGKGSTNGVYLSTRSLRLQTNEQITIYPGITIVIGNVELYLGG